MKRRALGSSGLEISTIGFGSWATGGWMWGGQDDRESMAAIHAAVDAGVNWIDTAPIYGSGHSEEIVGEALKALPRDRRPMVFTKYGLGDKSEHRRQSAERHEVLAECNASLKRLGVDCIDLYQLHWPAPQPIAETAGAIETLLTVGKIRAVGVSNFSVAQLQEWQSTGVPIHTLQCPYSILRPAAADELLPFCVKNNLGAIAYSPLFRGMLFGTWTADKMFPAGDARGEHKDYLGARFERHIRAVDEITAIAKAGGLTTAQLCVGVLLRTPGLTGCIVGARDARQGAGVADLDVDVPDAQVSAVNEITARLRADLATL